MVPAWSEYPPHPPLNAARVLLSDFAKLGSLRLAAARLIAAVFSQWIGPAVGVGMHVRS